MIYDIGYHSLVITYVLFPNGRLEEINQLVTLPLQRQHLHKYDMHIHINTKKHVHIWDRSPNVYMLLHFICAYIYVSMNLSRSSSPSTFNANTCARHNHVQPIRDRLRICKLKELWRLSYRSLFRQRKETSDGNFQLPTSQPIPNRLYVCVCVCLCVCDI